jgi:hypothetical protein
MSQRVDTLDRYYAAVESCNRWTNRIFWVNFALSVGIWYTNSLGVLKQWLNIAFITLVVGYFLSSNLLLSLYLLPRSEDMRKKHFITDSLGVLLDTESTSGYYNNSLSPSFQRLGANVMENALFTARVSAKMLKWERFKVALCVVSWLVCILCRNTNLDLIAIIAQTLFAGTILPGWVRLEYLRFGSEKTFNSLYSLYLTRDSTVDVKFAAVVVDELTSYEVVKARAGIMLSRKVFERNNVEISGEWEKVRRNLGL